MFPIQMAALVIRLFYVCFAIVIAVDGDWWGILTLHLWMIGLREFSRNKTLVLAKTIIIIGSTIAQNTWYLRRLLV